MLSRQRADWVSRSLSNCRRYRPKVQTQLPQPIGSYTDADLKKERGQRDPLSWQNRWCSVAPRCAPTRVPARYWWMATAAPRAVFGDV